MTILKLYTFRRSVWHKLEFFDGFFLVIFTRFPAFSFLKALFWLVFAKGTLFSSNACKTAPVVRYRISFEIERSTMRQIVQHEILHGNDYSHQYRTTFRHLPNFLKGKKYFKKISEEKNTLKIRRVPEFRPIFIIVVISSKLLCQTISCMVEFFILKDV